MFVSRTTAAAVVALAALRSANAGLVLNEKTMDLSETSAFLSSQAYLPEPNSTGFDVMKNFLEEPDQALVAEKNGYCFVAFRGTTLTMSDWMQNFEVGKKSVCSSDKEVCCNVRKGFFDAYQSPTYVTDLESTVNDCVKRCPNPDECLVLTGHSQGGAVAAVAAIHFSAENPYVITFGEPPSVNPGCKLVSASRWYRYVNSIRSETAGIYGISYDPVPFAPGLGTIVYGQMIILGADHQHVAYIGMNSTKSFSPVNVKGAVAHSMIGTERYPGYLDRIHTLVAEAKTYPIPVNGWSAPNYCTEDDECATGKCAKETRFSYERCVGTNCTANAECDTGRCDSGLCLPKLGSCMTCEEHSDCLSGKCLLFRCANTDGLMDDECNCARGGQCASGRCEGVAPPRCMAKVPEGARCNEHSDCLTGTCNWFFRCSVGGFRLFSLKGGLVVGGVGVAAVGGYYLWTNKFGSKAGYSPIQSVGVVA